MTMLVRKGGTWREITSAKVFKSGDWRDLVEIQVYKSSAWRQVANFTPVAAPPPSPPPPPPPPGPPPPPPPPPAGGGTMVLTATPASLSRGGLSSSQTSGTITATPSGGLTPITYAWSIVSQETAIASINSPTLASTTVSAGGLIADETPRNVVIRCVGTDHLGVVATSNTVTVSFTRFAVDTSTL